VVGNPLVSINIGEGVDLGTNEGEYGYHYAFDEDFDTYYSRGGGQAGTYTKNNDVWTNEKAEAYIIAMKAEERDWTWSETESQALTDKTWKTGNGIFTATLSRETLTISGTGSFEKRFGDFPWEDNPNLKFSRLVIDSGITEIPNFSFNDKQLTSVSIPNSVTVISFGAFRDNKLTSVTLPDNVTYIGNWAFLNNQLTSIIIPPSVTFLGEYAFGDNPLTSITIGANVEFAFTYISDHGVWDKFDTTYQDGGKQAGTYILNDSAWILHP